jgi:hypothetical protein
MLVKRGCRAERVGEFASRIKSSSAGGVSDDCGSRWRQQFVEPLDLFERHVDPRFRDRAVRLARDPATGKRAMLVDDHPMKLRDVEEVLGILSGYGQKEAGGTISTFDRYMAYSADWQDMDARARFLDTEGIATQVVYPSLGIIWEGEVEDPQLADALCRAYNQWAFDLVAGHRERLFPAAHISLRDPALAVNELERVAKLGCRIAFVAAMPINGKSFGHPDFDSVWATAQDLDLPIGLHVVSHRRYMGSDFHREPKPGLMYFTMNLLQDPRQALLMMVVDGVLSVSPSCASALSKRWPDGSANGLSELTTITSTWVILRV